MKIKNTKTKKKTFNGLSRRIMRITGICVAIAVIITAAVALFSMNSLIKEIAKERAASSVNVMKEKLDNISKTSEISAKTFALDQTIIDAITNKNSSKLLSEIKALGETLGIGNITVTDYKGSVLSSTYDTKSDDISNHEAIKIALAGNVFSGIDYDVNTKYSVDTSVPIYSNVGKVIGTISIVYNLDNHELVDNLKEITGDEFTVFAGDERISTSIINNGERAVGTRLDSTIADIVINNKQMYIDKAKIFDKNYITAYYPIISNDGNTVTGILFSGRDYSDVERKVFINIFTIMIIAILLIIVDISILANILNKVLKLPLEKVVNAAKAIETGDINDEVINNINGISTKDEIGLLARSMEGAMDSVKMMSDDIVLFHKSILNHDLTVVVDKSKHQGVYGDIVETVENLFSELKHILQEIKIMADGIDSGSSHVSAASQSLAQGSTEQASSTEELASTIEDISQQISENANNADQASSLSMDANSEVKVSSNHMGDMVNAMNNINNISNEISKIIKTIDDIAFQTNILALNAAVEAARAGAHGKGFAVVADEVRNLANKSADAAKSTAVLIEHSIEAVVNGSKIADITEQALQSVVEKTYKVNGIVYQIAEAAQKQSEGIKQISIGIEQISSVVQSNSATSEETAAASEELAAQAESLRDMVSIYKMKS